MTNNTTAALTDEQIIELLTAMDDAGFTQAERNNDRLRNAARALLTSPRAAVPEGWKLVPVEPTPEMVSAGEHVAYSDVAYAPPEIAYRAMLDAAPAAPVASPSIDTEQMLRDCVPGGDIVDPQIVCDNIREWFEGRAAVAAQAVAAPVAEAEPAPDPLRRRVERLLVELHAEGRLSEGQCTKMLDISRVEWRELAEFLAPAAQAVAADGASTQRCNLGVGCDEAGVCYASAHGDASQCGRAAVSPATAALPIKIPHVHIRPEDEEIGRQYYALGFVDGNRSITDAPQPARVVAPKPATADSTGYCTRSVCGCEGSRIETKQGCYHWRLVSETATAEPTDYAAIEREHFGDPDKRTGIYAPATADERAALTFDEWRSTYADAMSASDATLAWSAARASQAAAPADAREPDAYMTLDCVSLKPASVYLNREDVADMRPDHVVPLYRGGAPADAGEAVALTAAARDVLAERTRQVSVEGWTPEHDDQYTKGELALAASQYVLHVACPFQDGKVPAFWPWPAEWWKPTTPRRDLEKAGALIQAEIERLYRAEARTAGAQGGKGGEA
ncbi:hypothetical protein [Burkholderia glumae]|uniref:hypothetical protein n=1 Tax=Burkholderia glumae TaxID=337 RepID=UPI003B99A21B